jgi:predicted phage terminase large subunit-like protein
MNNSKKLQAEVIKAAKIELSRRHLEDFTKYTFPKYQFSWFHKAYTDKINDFAQGRIKKLMVFIPPQHGKSEISTRRLPPFLFGLDPNLNIAIISYSDTKAKKFNREIKRIINDQTYKDVFPEIELPSMMSNYTNSANEFEIVNHSGSCKAIGVGGALTGEPVDILIMDDLYKDAMSAWSETIRGNIEDWYDTVADTRLHNDSQQLIVFTRWHHLDLAGKLLKQEPEQWETVIFEAIKDKISNPIDPRQKGDPLWKEKHSIEKLLKSRERNPHVFQSLYQQQPKPLEGLLYSEFKTYSELPEYFHVKNYTDTADTGEDYLCSVDYIEHNNLKYIIDVLYTQKPNEYTEPALSEQMKRNKVNYSKIESNNGGRAFARNVARITKDLGNFTTEIKWFHQSKNKEARIKSNSSTVNNTVVMPDNWHIRWPEFYNDVTNYMAMGKNKHDDAVDVLTGIVETNNRTFKTKKR